MAATGGDGKVVIHWTPPAGDVGLGISVVAQRVIWRIVGKTDESTSSALSATADSYTVSGLIPATDYELTITASTSAGRYKALDPGTGDQWWERAKSGGSPPTPTATNTPTPTPAPTATETPTPTPTKRPTRTAADPPTVTPTTAPAPAHARVKRATRLSARTGSGEGQIVISWTPATGSNTLTITGQIVSWKLSSGGGGNSSTILSASASSYTIPDLEPGTEYEATVLTLVNNISHSSFDGFVNATSGAATTP